MSTSTPEAAEPIEPKNEPTDGRETSDGSAVVPAAVQLPPPPDDPRVPAGRALRRSLRSSTALRQAVLAREVLGPPVSLRRDQDVSWPRA